MKNFNTNIFHPAWVTGFIDGEGTLYIGLQPKSDMATGYQVMLQFIITQHIRDLVMMTQFIEFFGCGYLAKDGATKVQFRIRKFNDLMRLFELLDNYPLQSQKALDAKAFREVHSMMINKEHLTHEGVEKIKLIKASMNRGRMK
jgi:LAGLIDADG endonuclease